MISQEREEQIASLKRQLRFHQERREMVEVHGYMVGLQSPSQHRDAVKDLIETGEEDGATG